MSRLFEPAVNITVNRDSRGRPASFLYKGKLQRVKGVNSRWRVSEGWWRDPVDREYFQVETPGLVCVIYQDLNKGSWYLQRIYD